MGTVIAIGNGKFNWIMSTNIGDRVMYSKYGGTYVPHEGEDFIMLREADIFAVV